MGILDWRRLDSSWMVTFFRTRLTLDFDKGACLLWKNERQRRTYIVSSKIPDHRCNQLWSFSRSDHRAHMSTNLVICCNPPSLVKAINIWYSRERIKYIVQPNLASGIYYPKRGDILWEKSMHLLWASSPAAAHLENLTSPNVNLLVIDESFHDSLEEFLTFKVTGLEEKIWGTDALFSVQLKNAVEATLLHSSQGFLRFVSRCAIPYQVTNGTEKTRPATSDYHFLSK